MAPIGHGWPVSPEAIAPCGALVRPVSDDFSGDWYTANRERVTCLECARGGQQLAFGWV